MGLNGVDAHPAREICVSNSDQRWVVVCSAREPSFSFACPKETKQKIAARCCLQLCQPGGAGFARLLRKFYSASSLSISLFILSWKFFSAAVGVLHQQPRAGLFPNTSSPRERCR